MKEVPMFVVKEKKTYCDDEINELLKNINCPVKKFMTEVRKVMRLKTSTVIWWKFSDEISNDYDKLKSKYEGQLVDDNEIYNFVCCYEARYVYYHKLKIKIENDMVRVIDGFLDTRD